MPELSYPELIATDLIRLGPDGAKAAVQAWLGQAEDLYIDFKTKDDPSKGSVGVNDRRNLGKALSGFANSEGGLLVWGIDARKDPEHPDSPDVARDLQPIADIEAFHSELNSLIRLATKPTVPNVMNYLVYDDRAKHTGYVVTHVPPGTHPPYQAGFDNNNHFYKRSGSSFYPMEPFDLRDVIFRDRYPKIALEIQPENVKKTAERHDYSLRVRIKNHGPGSLHSFKLVLDIPRPIYNSASGTVEGYELRINNLPYMRIIVRRLGDPIFPEDELVILTQTGATKLFYLMDTHSFTAWPRTAQVFYALYGENMPPLKGEIAVQDLIDF